MADISKINVNSTTYNLKDSRIPDLNSSTTQYLRGDGTWATPTVSEIMSTADVTDDDTGMIIEPGSGGYTWTTLADQDVTIVSSSPNYFVINDYATPFAANQTYRITWGTGGTQYICQTILDETGQSYDGYIIGNGGVVGRTPDTGEPFLIYRDRATRLACATNQSAGTLHITIEQQASGGSGGTYQTKTNINPTTSSQTITPDSGYDALSSVQINAMPSGTAGTPTATKGTVSNNSVSITPSVTNTTGYITGSTKTGTAVTVSASELVSGNLAITQNTTTNLDVTNYATVSVNVSGIGKLLNTTSIGTVNTTSNSATSLNVSLEVTGVDDYDLLIVESSVNSVTNNRHTATVGVIFLTASSTVGTKNGAVVANAKWNSKASSDGTTTTTAQTTAYGIYPNSCSISSGTASIPMYRRYNSTYTGTINGTYTARVYGVKLYDLIGG